MKTREISHLLRVFFIFAAIQIVFDLVFAIFGMVGGTNSLLLPAIWDLSTLPIWLLVMLMLVFRKKEARRNEELESISLEKREKLESSQLFGEEYEDVLIKRQSRFLNRTLSPILVVLSLIMMIGISLGVYREMFMMNTESISAPIQGSVLLFRACISYILARYILGLSVPIGEGSLATLGGLGLYHCIQCVFLTALAFVDIETFPNAHKVFHVLLVLSIAVYVLEVIARSVMRLYAVEKSDFPPQCSSLVSFSFSENVIGGTHKSFEYQFGYDFKSSVREIFNQTGLYLIALLLLSMLASTCVGTIETGQVGFVEVFGKRKEEALQPGLYFKLPWPMAEVEKVDVGMTRRLEFGSEEVEGAMPMGMEEEAEDRSMFLTYDSSKNSLDLPFEAYVIDAVLHYRVSDPVKYLYSYQNTDEVVSREAERILTLELFHKTHAKNLLSDRSELIASIRKKLEASFAEKGLGVKVSYFSIPFIRAPKSTTKAFDATISAKQEKKQMKFEAEAIRGRLQAEVKGMRVQQLARSRAQAAQLLADVQSDLKYLEKVKPIFDQVGEVYLQRKTLESYNEAISKSRKYIILNNPKKEVDIIDLEDVIDRGVLDSILEAKD